MKILILDDRNLYAQKFIKRFDESWQIDIVTNCSFTNKNLNANVIVGSRREFSVCKQLSSFYDVVLDTDSLVEEDIETILDVINTSRYILFSTTQVYRFLDNRVHTEEEIDESYLREIGDAFIDCQSEPEKFYVREKIRVEFCLRRVCKVKSINYTILRIAKCYFTKDYYKDITWIKHRVLNGKKLVLHEDNIKEMGAFHPIFERDLHEIVMRIMIDKRMQNHILNIAQDQVISMLSLASIISRFINGDTNFEIVCIPRMDGGILDGIRIPCNSSLLVSNKALKELYDVAFTKTEEWVSDICRTAIETDSKLVKSKSEKIVDNEYDKYRERLKSHLEKALTEQNEKPKKGSIINIYENV
ncbi:MAG: hypothetical protein IKH28_10455 [Lachnospiraceae bacterium]|nr:hypothetical protein [Lachnospiraceae bacterium]